MKFYRDSTGRVSAYESDGSQDHLIPDGLTQMTALEVEAHVNPPKTPTQVIFEKISALEAEQSKPRRMREAMLGTDGGWMATIDAQIAKLRATL